MQEKTLTGGRSYYLDIARTIAIISISLNHAVNRTYDNYFGQMAEFLESSYLSSLLKSVATVFSHLGVPLFLMISGALLLHKRMETADDVKRFYRHNLLELFITAEIWYFIMYWFVFFDGISSGYWEAGLADTLLGCVKTMLFLDQITMSSMWYMPMILCLYTTIPFAAMLVKKLSLKALSLPLLLAFLYGMCLPALNSLLVLRDIPPMDTAVHLFNLCSIYYLYVFVGYFISQGGLQRLRTGEVAVLTVLLFALICGYQLYAYSDWVDYLVDYDFPLLLLCAMGLLELLRRGAEHLRGLRPVVTYLAKISFGIYFVHILIMSLLYWHMDFSEWSHLWTLLFLEGVSVGGSIEVVELLSILHSIVPFQWMWHFVVRIPMGVALATYLSMLYCRRKDKYQGYPLLSQTNHTDCRYECFFGSLHPE